MADYLRAQGAGDGDVIAWCDSPHAVYLLLDVDPGIRFMHVYTALSIGGGGEKVMREVEEAKQRSIFVVSDLEWVALQSHSPEEHAEESDALAGVAALESVIRARAA